MEKKVWLEKFTWDVVVELNRQACTTGKMIHQPSENGGYEKTKQLWESTYTRLDNFKEVVKLCRTCHRLAPFSYFNGNTFAGIARALSKEACESVGPTRAFLLRSAVGHFVAGVIEEREFETIFDRALTAPKESLPQPPAS